MEKNNNVMLWGLEKASSSKLRDFEGQNNNPKSTIKQKSKKEDKKEKKAKEQEKFFSPEEDYGIQDIPFLKKESSRIDKEIEDDINYDENLELQDKILELLDMLEEMQEKFGGGLSSVLQSNLYYDGDESESDIEGNGIIEEKPKIKISNAKNKKVSDSKIRAEKGSDKAKEIGQKLADARKKKREESGKLTIKEIADKKREEKAKLKGEKLKPWYYVGIFPKGYREATEDEAIKNHKVGSYGKHEVDILKYEFFEKYNILLSHDLTDDAIKFALLGTPKKIKRSFEEIEILGNKVENNKFSEKQKINFENKLSEEKHTNKNLIKAYNWIYKLYCLRKNKPYVKKIFNPPEKEEIISKKIDYKIPEKKEFIDPRLANVPKEIKKEIKKQTYDFKNSTDKISIPTKAFKDEKLKFKYAKQLFKKKIFLNPDYYNIEDIRENNWANTLYNQSKEKQFVKEETFKKEPETHNFENAFDKIAIPKKAFIEGKIKSKYAKQLFDKKILLHPEHYHEEDVKKYFYNKIGKGIGSQDAQKLISSGYKPEMNDIGDYQLDRDLSIDRARVYRNNKTGKTYVVHRGTKESTDWLNNAIYGLSPTLYRYTSRYKNAKDVQEKTLQKYGDNVDVIGHSQGAKLAEMISKGDKRVKDVITYNRPVGLKETLTPLDKNVTDVRSSYDPVSILAPYQKGNKPVTFENKSYNPLEQHSTKTLLENPNLDLGNIMGEGIVKRKPHKSQKLEDIVQSVVFMKPHWNVTNAEKWLKQHNYYNKEIHDSKTQIRFRQYNPEDLKDRHYISKKLKDENILLIISTMNNKGSGIMIDNYEFLTPKEHKELEYKKFFEAQSKHQKSQEKLDKEMKEREKIIKKATKSRVSKESKLVKDMDKTSSSKPVKDMDKTSSSKPVKGSQEAKDKMARVRAGKGL